MQCLQVELLAMSDYSIGMLVAGLAVLWAVFCLLSGTVHLNNRRVYRRVTNPISYWVYTALICLLAGSLVALLIARP